MAKSVADAQANWERKMANAGAKYDARTATMPANWVRGLTEFGMPPGPMSQQRYQAGIQGKGAVLQRAVTGKGPVLIERMRQGLSR